MFRTKAFHRMVDIMIALCVCILAARLIAMRRENDAIRSAKVSPTLSRQLVQPGEDIVPGQGTWERGRRRVMLVVSTSCPACNKSVPFYRTLAEYISRTPSDRLTV